MHQKKCIVCAEFFSAKNKEQKICSIECRGLARKKHSFESIKEKLSEISDYELAEDFQYENQHQKIKLKHVLCGMTFDVAIQMFFNKGTRCPNKHCVSERIKETNLRNHGVEWAQQNKEIRQKSIKTNIERYGVDNVLKLDVNMEKCRRINSENLEQIKEKRKKTFIEKYGVESYPLTDEFLEKTKVTNIKRYGAEWCQQNKEIKKKASGAKKENFYKNIIQHYEELYDIKPLFSNEEYNGVQNGEYKFQCLKCNSIFIQRIDGTFPVPKCYRCSPANHSKPELELLSFIEEVCPSVQSGKRFGRIELDVFIPELNIGFEFDGTYWHSELSGGKDKHYHINKNNFFLQQGINVFHIWENEWRDKNDIVKSIILNKLNKVPNTAYAKNLNVKEIDNDLAEEFYNKNHIQGHCESFHHFALADVDNKIYSCLSVSKPRVSKRYDYEITRFANVINYNIVDGFSKLFDFFKKTFNKNSILAYVDRRYFTGKTYIENGLHVVGEIFPDCLYTKDYINLEQVIPSVNSEEWENMKINGFDRIWNLGGTLFSTNSNLFD